MKQSFNNHQKQLDDAAEIDALAEDLERDAREKLSDLRPVLYRKRNGFGQILTDTKTSFDVWEALHSLCDMTMTQAVAWMGTNLEHLAIKKVIEARAMAVDHVLAEIDFKEWAAAERELSERKNAA